MRLLTLLLLASLAAPLGAQGAVARPRDEGDTLVVKFAWKRPAPDTVRVVRVDTLIVHDTVTVRDTVTLVRVDTLLRVDTVVVERPPVDTATPPAPPVVGVAALPRDSVDVRMPAVTGATRVVRTADELRTALAAAQAGDAIVVQPGRYVGSFVLRARGDSGWVTVTAAGPIPKGPGVRVTPADAAWMPTLSTPGSNQPALTTSGAGRGWHVVGLEVTAEPGAFVGALVSIAGHTASTLDAMPGRITLDRVYVHPQPGQNVRRCVLGNGADVAVVDSWLADCHHADEDAQAFVAWNGPGPYLLRNNYLSGSGEVVMFGGSDSRAPELMPRDITLRGNLVTRPVEWQTPKRFLVKNLLELKVGQRVDVEGNVFAHNWADGQTGFALLFKSVNQEGSAPWSETSDVTVRCNVIGDAAGAVSLAGKPETHPAVPASRMTFAHNVISEIGPNAYPNGKLFQIASVPDVTFAHNTMSAPHTALYLVGADSASQRLTVIGNVFSRSAYGIYSEGAGGGVGALNKKAPGWRFEGNSLPGVPAAYPPGNSYDGAIPAGAGADAARVAACVAGVAE